MAKFSTHTFIHDGLVSHSFGPGEVVPEWAEKLVGAHVLVPEAAPVPTDDEVPDPTEDATAEESEADGEPEGDTEEPAPTAKPKAAAAPDFTGSAPRRRQSRK